MRAQHVLVVCFLLAFVLTLGLAPAQAQDEVPIAGDSLDPDVPWPATALTNTQALPPLVESEPNDTRASADRIDQTDEFAMQVSGYLDNVGRKDYFEFFGLPGDQVVVSFAANRYGSLADPVVTLYNGAGLILAQNDDYGGTFDPRLWYTLTAEGYYYLEVQSAVFLLDPNYQAYWYDFFIWMPWRHNDEYALHYGLEIEEPNNTRATAYPTAYGFSTPWTAINYPGDVDYFKFEGKAGDRAVIKVESTALYSELSSRMALYNSSGTLLASCGPADWLYGTTNCILRKVLPATGTYTIQVTDALDRQAWYWLQLGLYESAEPNDNRFTATELTYGVPQRGQVTAGDYCDYYRFQGTSGRRLTVLEPDYEVEITDQNGGFLFSNYFNWGVPMSVSLPYTGFYHLSVCASLFLSDVPLAQGDYDLVIDEVALAGVRTNGMLGTLSVAKGDILAYLPSTNRWAMVFDASDVGVTANLMDFALDLRWEGGVQVPDAVLMAFGTPVTLTEFGTPFKAQPQDVVRFAPGELGDDTSGYWSMVFDGSSVGLTTLAERIDAVFLGPYGADLMLSTVGTAKMKGVAGALTVQDEDLFTCSFDASGGCSLIFDGSAAGIPAAADVASVWYSFYRPGDRRFYMTFAATTTIRGVTYKPNDVAVCDLLTLEPTTTCNWEAKRWVGDALGLKGKYVDGLDFVW